MVDDVSRVTVAFWVEDGSDGLVEHLYALPLGADLFSIDNSPFYVYGISFSDIVYAPLKECVPTFEKVEEYRGHSTYRIRLATGEMHTQFLSYWKQLSDLGCTYEGSGVFEGRLYSIDVPASSDVNAVYLALELGEASGWWEFEEAHFGDSSMVKRSM